MIHRIPAPFHILALDDRGTRVLLDEAEPVTKPGATPKWNRLFPLGATKYRSDFPGGSITFSADWCNALVRNAKALVAKGHRIQVNYHHLGGGSVDGTIPLENTVASGWIVDVEMRDDGPYGLFKWTDRARKFIEAEELAYLSPEFYPEYTSRDTGKPQGPTLVGAALTNSPFLKELPQVAASDAEQSHEVASAAIEGAQMDKKLLCARLGLAETATDEEIAARILKLTEGAKALTLSEGTAASKLAELSAVTTKLSEENAALKATMAATALAAKDAEAEGLVDSLVKSGRVAPAIREQVKKLALTDGGPALVKATFGALPSQLGEQGHSEGADARTDAPATATQLAEQQKSYWAEVDKEEAKSPELMFHEVTKRVNRTHPELAKAIVTGPTLKPVTA